MKTKMTLLLLVAAATFFAIGRITAQTKTALHKQTQENLSTAMRGEAFAYAKYTLYSDYARRSGDKELADLFEKAARTERFEHFAEEAEIAGLAGSNADNLRDAIKGESYEVNTMYFEFAQQAADAGDMAAAEKFEEIRHDEMGHRDAFKAALAKLEASTKPAER